MKRLCLLLIFACMSAQAITPAELEAAKQAARDRAAAAAGLDLGENAPAPSSPGGGGAQVANNGCLPRAGDGRISLLGVQSDMGPSSSGGDVPSARLQPDHPAMRPLLDLNFQMGGYTPRQGASAEEVAMSNTYARRRELADKHERYLASARILGENLVIDANSPAYLRESAQAHAEVQALRRQYAQLLPIAQQAARACP